ncbi:MAG: peptidylprolyl isomerase [Novosphingobium sp.]|uniref:peptidylprolyl isomerase n=1 Tax=Novosphingobium sp. TaxID=1874826 RepID=UPI0032BD83EF
MRKPILALSALLLASASTVLAQASANQAAGRTTPSPLAPSEIVANAPKGDWTAIAASDLLVMDLTPDAKGKPRRVVIQLMPAPFSQGWIGNIRKLAAAHWWDGTAINRVQDNYVVQWGDPDAEDKTKARALPAGLAEVPESDYTSAVREELIDDPIVHGHTVRPFLVEMPWNNSPIGDPSVIAADDYAARVGFWAGWPLAGTPPKRGLGEVGRLWPVHCYGMVGVGRDLSPNTGSGAELYTVIGHAPRHLDRNIALVGRVIEGMEHLSSLPRGHGALGFYDLAQGDERTGITSIRLGNEVQGLPAYEYLSTESQSFASFADARANRRDAFFIRPAGGADVCNIPVPVRRVATK